MKSSIRNEIDKMREKLIWPVAIEYAPNTCEIVSDIILKQHKMILSTGTATDPQSELGILHEYCHAYFTETVHPMLGMNRFIMECDEKDDGLLGQLFRVAKDWFVDGFLMELVPDQKRKQISKTYLERETLIRQSTQATLNETPWFWIPIHALYTAEYTKWVYPQCCSRPNLAPMVQAFLAVTPSPVTLDKFQAVIESLFGQYGYQIELQHTAELPSGVWSVTPAQK